MKELISKYLKKRQKQLLMAFRCYQKGLALPDGYIETLEAQGQLSMPFVETEDQASYTQGLADLRF